MFCDIVRHQQIRLMTRRETSETNHSLEDLMTKEVPTPPIKLAPTQPPQPAIQNRFSQDATRDGIKAVREIAATIKRQSSETET